MIAFLKKASVISDLIGLAKTAAVLVGKFPSLAPTASQVFEDVTALVADRSFDAAEKIVTDVKAAFEQFAASYSRDDASVRAFIDAIDKICADAR